MTARAAEHRMVLPGQTPEGEPILCVLFKRSYRLRSNTAAARLEHARPLVSGDVYVGEPARSPVAFETDLVPWKVATDIVVNATAYAPDAKPTYDLVASVAVGRHRKDVLVTGDRAAQHRPAGSPVFSEPVRFVSLPLSYDRAYGGVDVRSDPSMAATFLRNPVGRGFVVRNEREAVDGLPLPNVEDPADVLTGERLCCGHIKDWEAQPMPDGLGWFARHWWPRAQLAGTMPGDKALEATLRRAYAKAIPAGLRSQYAQTRVRAMDFRFFNGASRGLVRPFLAGDEVLAFRNLHPAGDVVARLPGEQPLVGLDYGSPTAPPAVAALLHTVMIRLDELEVDLTWRAAFPYPGLDWLVHMRRLDVSVT